MHSSRLGLLRIGVLFSVVHSTIWVGAQTPIARTQSAAPVRATMATLNGMVVAKGNVTTVWFEWGTNTDYGTISDPQNIGNGIHVIRVSTVVQDLIEGGIYHFRIVASNSVGVSRGFDAMFTTAMKVQNWGAFGHGLPVVPSGLTNLSGIASGHGHCIALRNNGTVAAWMVGTGYPNYGQTNVPAGLSNVISVAGGFSHCMALSENGTVVAWGKYADGNSPNAPPNLSNVIAIAGGDYHSAALKADGTVVEWGTAPLVTNVPAGLVDVVAISCGSSHTLALRADGTVQTWGTDAGSISAPSSETNLVAVTTMASWNLALRADGTVLGWGNPFYTNVPKPTSLTNVVAIATGYGSAEVLKADGTLVAWGRSQDVPNIPPGLHNVVAMASGDEHRVGLAPINLPPRSFGGSDWGGTNKALTISLSPGFFDPNGDLPAFQIASLPTNGVLYQYATNGLGDPISVPGTSVADSSRVIFVPAPDAYGNPYDTFTFVASDGELLTAPATWTVSILPPPIIKSGVIRSNPNAFRLIFVGLTNAKYSVWGSVNLNSWSRLGSALQFQPGQFYFDDSSISSIPDRFYRIRAP